MEMHNKRFAVSGTHPHPDYVLNGAEIRVSSCDYGNGLQYYASGAKLGCGKNARTPEGAIRLLCSDHAITVTSITAI